MATRKRRASYGDDEGGAEGVGIDAAGNPVSDPTLNVIALSAAASKRQDDLRQANEKCVDERLGHLEQMAILRAEHSKEIAGLESSRLNAIRQVDVLAVSTAADRAAAAIQALAATTAANAENLRNAVTTTATSIAAQMSSTVGGITERLAALEKSSYEGVGKQKLADPMMVELIAEMKSLRESRSAGAGKSAGISASWGILIGVAGLILTVLSIIAVVVAFSKP